jgi:excisionase family DNA binding protein
MAEEKLLLDVREVASLLGVSPRSVWEWSDSGQIPKPISLGRLRRWRRMDLEDWLRQAAGAKGVARG